MDWVELLDKLKLWQFTLFMAVALGGLGFTGESILGGDGTILEGKENMAIFGFFILLAVSILLRYLPPPDRRHNGRRDGMTYEEQQIEIKALKKQLGKRAKK